MPSLKKSETYTEIIIGALKIGVSTDTYESPRCDRCDSRVSIVTIDAKDSTTRPGNSKGATHFCYNCFSKIMWTVIARYGEVKLL